MLAVFKKELRNYFLTPTGYIFMASFLLVSGFFFTFINLMQASPKYTDLLSNLTFLFLIIMPILTMRLIAEETRQKTDQLLLTSPLGVGEMVLGKYLAAVTVFLITLLITCLYPLIMSFYGFIATGEIFSGYIGLFLLGSCFIAIGLFVSSLTDNQISAAVITFAALLLLWLIDAIQQGLPNDTVSGVVFAGLIVLGIVLLVYYATRNIFVSIATAVLGIVAIAAVFLINKSLFDGIILKFIDWFSVLKRYEKFVSGILSLDGVVYYLSFITAFVFLTIQMIEKRRWN